MPPRIDNPNVMPPSRSPGRVAQYPGNYADLIDPGVLNLWLKATGRLEPSRQLTPYGPIGGLLDTRAGVQAPLGAPGLLQPVGDVIDLKGRGLLHSPDLLADQQSKAGLPSAGGGLLGSKWRDPTFVESYAKSKGIPPGKLKPATKPQAQVVEHPKTRANRMWDEGMAMSDARQAAMTIKSLSDLKKGERIQMHPATDTWMRGDRDGQIVGWNKAKNYFRVKMDVSGRTIKVTPDNLFRKLPQDWVPPRSGAYRTPWENMTPALWAKMNDTQQSIWKRDAGYSEWPATIRQGWKAKMGMDKAGPLRQSPYYKALSAQEAAAKAEKDFGVTITPKGKIPSKKDSEQTSFEPIKPGDPEKDL